MTSIVLDNICVDYKLFGGSKISIAGELRRMALGGAVKGSRSGLDIEAIQNVSLEFRKGDRVALIGHYGAGITTLLKVMAGILPPTGGRVRIEGKVSALLSIQLGLNMEWSGFENIISRARLMGHTEAEIAQRKDEIAKFSELEDYLALPMKTYSSGMRLRLAFAVATAFEPDILILDEWLSAGDEDFRQKAAARLDQLIERTGILIFASHNKELQRSVCNKGVLLSKGKLAFCGGIQEAFAARRALTDSLP